MYETGFSRTDEIGAVHCKMARAGLALTIRGLAEITGLSGSDLKQRLRTGTVYTTDDRDWELRSQNCRLGVVGS